MNPHRPTAGYDGREATLEEVAQELGVSRQRAQQIEQKALAKCRVILEAHGLTLTALLQDELWFRRRQQRS